MPTEIQWQLPAGVTAGDIQWPVPEKLPYLDPETHLDMTSYIYHDEVVLLVALTLSPELHPGPVDLSAQVSWLECEANCVPGKGEVHATLQIGPQTKTSTDAAVIQRWQKKLPENGAGLAARAWWDGAVKKDLRPLIIEWNSAVAARTADFFPYVSKDFEVQGDTTRLPSDAGKIRVRANVRKLEGEWPKSVSGLLVQKAGDQQAAYEASVPVRSSPLPAVVNSASDTLKGGLPAPPLWKVLLFAFIGGLILNVMPCVLPVISLKILGFVAQSKEAPGRVRALGLIYAAGVLVSFLVLASVFIGLQLTGHKVGWGIQFSNPYFLVVLTVVVTLVALNLFGLFEVNLGGRVMGAAGALASQHGAAGAFFNGVLATALATPCTAPIFAGAVGFAFLAQNAGIMLLIFVAAAVGLASPYVILSWNPAWLKFLPKPGAWMHRFKIAMGFPMLATAFWLLSLIPIHYGERSWWLGLFLVLIGLAAWMYGEFVQRGSSRRGMVGVILVALIITSYIFIMEGRLQWRSPLGPTPPTEIAADNSTGIQWQKWTPDAVNSARSQGRPVLVDFTAKWCLTCNTIVKPALENAAVRKKLKETNALPLLGDYTSFPADITDELNRLGRAGVPVVLVYPKDSNAPPMVYDVVTSGTVLEALDRAAR